MGKDPAIEKSLAILQDLVRGLPTEEDGQSDLSQTDSSPPSLEGGYGTPDFSLSAVKYAETVIANVPHRIYNLAILVKEIKPEYKDPRVFSLYSAIVGEVAQLGLDFSKAREVITRQGRSLETLKRYERETRKTLTQLLDFLQLQIDHEEGQIPVNIIGGLELILNKGDNVLLGPGTIYMHEGADRINLWRELYMLKGEVPWEQKAKEVLFTAFRRFLTGEQIIQDHYIAKEDGAKLSMSSDEVGGNIVRVDLLKDTQTKEIISRRCVYLGSEEGVMLRVYSSKGLGRKIYGPGLFLQKFQVAPGYTDKTGLFLQIDGEIKSRQLKEGEILPPLDPRNSYAWESSVTYDLSRFGSVGGRLVRGDIPYWVKFKGPGKIWYSKKSFDRGYIGFWFTPACYLHFFKEFVTRKIFGSG